jgi:hypothetical protein
MVRDCKIVVYLAISNHKYAKIVIPQILAQKSVDSLILLMRHDDTYTKGYLQTVAIEYGDKITISQLNVNKSFNQSVTDFLRKTKHTNQDLCLYFADKICFIDNKCIETLSEFVINNPEYELICPAVVNTDRTTYIYQVTNHLKPYLLWRWDTEYFDTFTIKDAKPEFRKQIHESFLDEAESKGVENMKFEYYIPTSKETKHKYAFASRGDTFANHFKEMDSVFSAICGNSICSWFSDDKYLDYLEKTAILSRYQALNSKIESHHKQYNCDDDVSNFDMGFPLGSLFISDNDEINIAISSHVSTVQKTLPVLLKSLEEAAVQKERILVVVGGSPKEYLERKNGILYSYVQHNSYDHNALIDIAEKGFGGDRWFVMHDTAKVGQNFMTKIAAFGHKANYVSVFKEGWLNMGLFSKKAIQEMRPYILQLKNCNKMQAILSEKMYSRMTDSAYFDISDNINFVYFGDVYGDGVDRQTLYIESLDLYKFQSYHYYSESTKQLVDSWLVK